VLLDDGMSCEAVAKVLLPDDDTIRTWYRRYQEEGIEGLANFGYEGGACRLTDAQQERLTAWISETPPRTTREIGGWIAQEFGIDYQGRSGLIALLHRLGMEHRKPKAISRKLAPACEAGSLYQALQRADEPTGGRRSGDVCRRGASDACGTAGWLLGAEGPAGVIG
jgi:transposase